MTDDEAVMSLPEPEPVGIRSGAIPDFADEVARVNRLHVRFGTTAHVLDRRAVACGEALIKLKAHVEATLGKGHWGEWVASSGLAIGYSMAEKYMRFTKRHDELPADFVYTSIPDALSLLKGLPAAFPNDGAATKKDWRPEDTKEVKRLISEGMPRSEVADIFDVSATFIARKLDPETAKRNDAAKRRKNAEYRQAKRVAEKENNTKAALEYGGSASRAFALRQRMVQELEWARSVTEDRETRNEYTLAINSAAVVEFHILCAMKLERRRPYNKSVIKENGIEDQSVVSANARIRRQQRRASGGWVGAGDIGNEED